MTKFKSRLQAWKMMENTENVEGRTKKDEEATTTNLKNANTNANLNLKSMNANQNLKSSIPKPMTARRKGRPPKILSLKGQPKIEAFLEQKSRTNSQAHCTTRLVGSTDERDSSLVQHSTSTIDADIHATLVGNKTTEVGKSMGNGAAHRDINGQL